MSSPMDVPQMPQGDDLAQSPDNDDFVLIPNEQSLGSTSMSMITPTPEMNQNPRDSEVPPPNISDLFSIFDREHEREALQPIMDTLSSTHDVLERLHRSIEVRNAESQELRDSLKETCEKHDALEKMHLETIEENQLLKTRQEELLAQVFSLECTLKEEGERASVAEKKETEAAQMQTVDERSLLEREKADLLDQLRAERTSRENVMILMAKLNDELQEAQSQKADAEGAFQKAQEVVEAERQRRLEAEQRAAALEVEMAAMKECAEREREQLFQQNISGSDACLQRIAILENSLVSDTEARLELQRALEKACADAERNEAELRKALEAVKFETKTQVERARADATETMQELAQVLHNVEDLRSELAEGRKEAERLKTALEQCQNEKRNLEFMLEDCMNENRNLSEAVQLVQRERDGLESENRALRIDYCRRLQEHEN
ncbi:hypothetical protein QR680_009477 [Steinernema hermaphroditum]|uniref:Uncharacterized protein n=1 Tax=Steinernema hermaphroditum TaxID=289476 RepID=A0AA39M9Z6_9BILA|nr:hypothetical protein QR680_009477 [Steinernema hermaphroditum]